MEQVQYSVIVTDDHPMVASGLEAIINEQAQLHITHTVNSGKALLELLEKETADLIVLDISMAELDGIQVAGIIRGKYPAQKILCISTYYQPSLYTTLKAIPVQGFIPKLADINIMVDGIYRILKNEEVFIVRTDEFSESNKLVLREIAGKLSRREMEIMKLIKEGKSSKDISKQI